MTKILGLDLGTNSIGWAVIDKDSQKIVDCGVRIFPEGVVKESIGQGDKEISKNAERREHRQARRLHYRKRLRKIQLLKVLIDHQMCPLTHEDLKQWSHWDKARKASGRKFPATKEFVHWLRMNPYALRVKALRNPISRMEFGRILYHFIQRRGFLSSRKGSDDGAIYKGSETMQGITDTQRIIGEDTLGQAMNKYLPVENAPYKHITDEEGKDIRIRARYTLREMYIAEFERIWQQQAGSLGLNDLSVSINTTRFFEGDIASITNQARIRKLKEKYEESNVQVCNGQMQIKTQLALKEFLAGEIIDDNEGIKFNSNNSILFWQRPLRSQKNLLGKCTFESRKFFDKKTQKWIISGATPTPVSHPEFELFRAYQFINNIRYGQKGTNLNDLYRQQVLSLINNEDGNFDFAKIPKKLKMTYEHFNYDNKLKAPGNTTHKRLMSFFDKKVWEEQNEEIWHYFYFYSDPDLLAKKLIERFGFDDESAKKASKVKLKEGYGSVSLKAIRNILPFLELGYQYSTAVILGGVKNAFGQRWDYFKESHQEIISRILNLVQDEQNKEYELIQKIKEFLANPANGYGFAENDRSFQKLYHHSQEIEKKALKNRLSEIENLRNPIVQKGLHEMRRLVNTLLDTMDKNPLYGPGFKFDRIHVELSRDLRNSKSQRQEMSYRIRDNEAANDEARKILQEFGLKPSRENITKYRLYKEIKDKNGVAVCPYTKKTISIADLFGRNNLYQIEHIIPYSISLDDSFANKTLCESNFNRDKGEKTPYEYYAQNKNPKIWSAASWEEIEQRTFAILPYQKARRFIARKSFLSDSFIERQLNDGRYIAKKSAELLTEICDDVRVMPGQLTAELRRLWGLNNVIQPVFPLNLPGIKVADDQSIPHYVVLDNDHLPRIAVAIPNERPVKHDNQILIPGISDEKGVFEADTHYHNLKFNVKVEGLKKGRYWAKINVSKPLAFTKVFVDKPELELGQIIYKGRVEKGYFNHDSIGKKVRTSEEDGLYWVKFIVKNTTFVEPEKDRPPAVKSNQVMLYGNVNVDNLFTSYIYQCECNMNPGRYWAILDIDFESAEFTKAVVQPKSDEGKLIIYGIIGEDGSFIADCDPGFNQHTKLASGRYFTVLEVERAEGYYEIENQPPQLKKGETLVQGNVWVNKQTGEIMFDPKKNRDDHRHHAVDAIAIAFTELGYLQKLSRYFGEIKERERGLGDRPVFHHPWANFDKDVKNAVDRILVSYSPNEKILTKISKVIIKNGKKYQSVGFSARGRLHREYYFGRHPRLVSDSADGFGFEKDRKGNIVYYYHIRKPITSIENHKHVEKIVDAGIRKLIVNKLREQNIHTSSSFKIPQNFFYDKEGNPLLFLPNKRGEPVPVKKVRLRESIGNAVRLKDDLNQWVNPYNNHHVVIYLNEKGELKESIVSFWEVIERIQQGQEIYQLPGDGTKMITTLRVNEMFLLNLPEDLFAGQKRQSLSEQFLSKHLYRVQKLSSMYYTFRHHLASTIQNEKQEWRIQSMSAWTQANPVKVKMDLLGNIEII